VSLVAWHRPLRDRPWRLLLVSVGTTFRTDTFDVWANDPSSFVRNQMFVSLEGEEVNYATKNLNIWLHYFYTKINLLSLYLSAKGRHHFRREGLKISHVNPKKEEFTLLTFMKIPRSRLIQRIHKFIIKIRKSKESIFNTNILPPS
jgi:hypothetical protein